jgi:hypothetical protein
MTRCKLPSVASTFLQAGNISLGYPRVEWYACDNGTDQESHGRADASGTQIDNKSVVRTGGASDGLASFSEKLVATSGASLNAPFQTLPMDVWNSVTGSNRTLTLYGVVNGAAVPTNAEIWPEMHYLGDASSLKGSLGTGGIANALASGSNWTADATSAWDSQVTTRQNSHAYSVGDIMKTASNPGRIFFCTASSGNSAGSEPGGYASAVDGGVVTDGSCTFRAGFRFSMAITVSAPQPQLAGIISAIVKVAKASTTYFIDPLTAASLS